MFRKKESWKDVLNLFYENIPDDIYYSRNAEFCKEKDILPKLNEDKKESILKFLSEHKFIEGYSSSSKFSKMRITKEGIDLTSQNEKIEKESKIQMNLALFTILLALITLWQTMRLINFFEQVFVDLFMAAAIMIILVLTSLYNLGMIDAF